MNLTPLDVRRKQFDKGFRGYDPTEVDLFLKQLADRLEELQEEARRSEERVREIEGKLTHYEKVELALQEALQSARETAKRAEATAEEKARLIVQRAELRAEEILRDAERERHGLRQDIVRLTSRQNEAAARLRGFLMSELEVLAQFQGDEPFGFIRLEPANAQGTLPAPPAQLGAAMPRPDAVDLPPADEAPADEAPSAYEPPTPEPSAPVYEAAYEPSPAAYDPPLDEAVDSWVEREPEAPAPAEPPSPPPADPSTADTAPSDEPMTGAYAAADDPPPAESAVTGGWDLRSLVTGEERSVTASDEERDRIRRILDDLD